MGRTSLGVKLRKLVYIAVTSIFASLIVVPSTGCLQLCGSFSACFRLLVL